MSAKKDSENRKKLFLLIGIPLLLILSLVLLMSKTKRQSAIDQFPVEGEAQIEEALSDEQSPEQFPAEAVGERDLSRAKVAVPRGYKLVTPADEERRTFFEQIRNKAPINPTKVIAKASSDPNAEELQWGQPYSYPNPVFTWSGERVRESGVKIIGYMVYFGESHFSPDFLNEAKFQTSNTYTASNLEAGKNYYLMVRVVTDSQTTNQVYGFDQQLDGRPVRPLFMYHYQ